jgi:tetratricopeptide (TPR) repeat protein
LRRDHAAAPPVPTGAATIGPTGATEPAERASALRLARLHLRLGSLGLARAELEALAGSGELDEAALLDLAEVRWRTGDLPGAGEAAAAALSTGDEDVLALVIAAEAAAAASRPAEARRLAGQALERADVPLDRIFAGMPRSQIWPHDVEGAEPAQATPEATPAATSGGARIRASVAPRGRPVEHLEPVDVALAGPFDSERAIATARSELDRGESSTAASRLALVLRFAPSRAAAVLTVLGEFGDDADPPLDVVRGDALVQLGRDDEAQAAYRAALEALEPARRVSATTAVEGDARA